MRGRDHFEDRGIDMRIILKWILGKWFWRVWIGFIWRAVVKMLLDLRVP
jgi:hypothetical protein